MGLTIHYKLTLNNATIAQAREKIVALRKAALQLPFKRVDELVEIAGDACYFDDNNCHDTHAFLKIRALQPIEIYPEHFSFKEPTYIIAFDSLPGEGSEMAVFGFAAYSPMEDVNDWLWTGFCKTQYASNPEYGGLENFFKCHLLIVKMLDVACELGITCEVTDESGYWEHRNLEELTRIIRQHNLLIAAFVGTMKDHLDAGNITSIQSEIFDYPNFEYLEAEGKNIYL